MCAFVHVHIYKCMLYGDPCVCVCLCVCVSFYVRRCGCVAVCCVLCVAVAVACTLTQESEEWATWARPACRGETSPFFPRPLLPSLPELGSLAAPGTSPQHHSRHHRQLWLPRPGEEISACTSACLASSDSLAAARVGLLKNPELLSNLTD